MFQHKRKNAERELADFRRQIDDFFGRHPQSPLDRAQQRAFTGLTYYDWSPDLVFELDVDLFDDEPAVEMQTSTGDVVAYRRWGRVTFTVAGAAAALTIYSSDPHGHDLFLPFKDATNGAETYGAGRYLDSHRPGVVALGRGRIRLDLNYAYNPYCAYSEMYSCPLPPRENWLSVPIRAGEKAFE